MTRPTSHFVRWLRANPLAGRMLLKIAIALPLGGGAGLVLIGLGSVFGFDRNIAAVGAALATFWGSQRLAPSLARRLDMPENTQG